MMTTKQQLEELRKEAERLRELLLQDPEKEADARVIEEHARNFLTWVKPLWADRERVVRALVREGLGVRFWGCVREDVHSMIIDEEELTTIQLMCVHYPETTYALVRRELRHTYAVVTNPRLKFYSASTFWDFENLASFAEEFFLPGEGVYGVVWVYTGGYESARWFVVVGPSASAVASWRHVYLVAGGSVKDYSSSVSSFLADLFRLKVSD